MTEASAHTGQSTGAMIAQWLGAIALGGLAGGALAKLAPLAAPSEGHYQIPLWLCVPFVTLLLSIACGPLFFAKLWHRFDAAWAFFLGSLVAVYYLLALTHDHHGLHHLQHVANEYLAFIALVAGLYIASAGIVVHYGSTEKFQEGATFGHATHGGYRGTGPLANTTLLLLGALLANAVGTTGASVLLIRPFIRANAGRLTPMHVVFFILIVSNCGGCLTPIGDPPLYLGYIKGIPFFWELQHMWASWLIVVGGLLAVYYLYDRRVEASLRRAMQDAYKPPAPFAAIRIRARWSSIVLGGLISAGVFIDPIIHRYIANTPPVGPWIQLGLAALSFALADKSLVRANEFSFAPAKEVATLFAGIFLTMMPALTYLAEHGKDLGIDSPIKFYFATGTLSAVLDNAPTYLNFLQVALAPQDVTPDTVHAQLATGEGIADVIAISTGAVFFGALTYIGNGPNFMVRAIAQSRGVAMPSFFAYAAWACLILVPILVLHALIVF